MAGFFTEYLNLGPAAWVAERKEQLERISALRGRDVLVYASAGFKQVDGIPIDNRDIAPIRDQLTEIEGSELDLIVETPGGSAEAVERIVCLLRARFSKVGVIVPGSAMSAGTILALSGDEILMDESSCLGPIDAQIVKKDKVFSADALMKGFAQIKADVEKTGKLNMAYVPMLREISPGELQHAENALELAVDLVKKWLVEYKWRDWATHRSTGLPVTKAEKHERAEQIARDLTNQERWRSHGRAVRMEQLSKELRLEIVDFGATPDLRDAIRRYFTLVELTFQNTNVFKLIETKRSHIARLQQQPTEGVQPMKKEQVATIVADMTCPKCGTANKLQITLDPNAPPAQAPDAKPIPVGDTIACRECGLELDLRPLKAQIQMQFGKPICY